MYSELNEKTILITGANGLIGKSIVSFLLRATGAWIVAEGRDAKKLKVALRPYMDEAGERLRLLERDLLAPYGDAVKPDYIIHTAAPTATSFFVKCPVETIDTIVLGARNVLELALSTACKGTVVLSSLEVYGSPFDEVKLTEDRLGYLDPMAVRSSYPEAKRLAEAYIAAYASEHSVRAMSVRLAQTFGPGVEKDDNRVFAQFIRAAASGEDIALASEGKTSQMYISIDDAVTAILTVLLHGKAGEAYNAANEQNYTSIADMARLVNRVLAGGRLGVLTGQGDRSMYPPERKVYQDTSKLRELGWQPADDLETMYRDTAEYLSKMEDSDA
jgi:nucleoside-diphosphate-sugar epimerase